MQLKSGIYEGYGMNRELLEDLLMFYSSFEKKTVTLEEYVSRMKEDQKYIYYACGETVDRIDKLPYIELLKDKGFEVLYLTDGIDEFVLKMLHQYKEKEFKSAAAGDLELEETEEEKQKAKAQEEENKELLDYLKECLGDKVSQVRLSQRLKTHPVCLTSEGELSLEMEKVLNAMPTEQKLRADRVLEINAGHPVLKTLHQVYETDREKVKQYAELLYDQALLIEGFPIDDPVAFSNAVCELMVKG